MTLNNIKIKKYRARVKDRNANTTANVPISEDGYKVVEGYVSISAVILPYETNDPIYKPIFVAEEPDFRRMATSGMGVSVFHPTTYGENEFEILGEVEE